MGNQSSSSTLDPQCVSRIHACGENNDATNASISAVLALDDERVLVASKDGTLKLWRVHPRADAGGGHFKHVATYADRPNGGGGGGDGDDDFDFTGGDEAGEDMGIYGLVRVDDGRFASAHEDSVVRVWDIVDDSGGGSSTGGGRAEAAATAEAASTRMVSSPLLRLEGHKSWVYCVESLSASVLVSGSFDNTARVWDLTHTTNTTACTTTCTAGTVKSTATLRHPAGVWSTARIDDRSFLTGGADGTIRYFRRTAKNASTAAVPGVIAAEKEWTSSKTYRGHRSAVMSIVLVNDDKSDFVTASADGSVRYWKLIDDGGCRMILHRAHGADVLCAVRLGRGDSCSGSSGSGSSATVATTSEDGTCCFWNPANSPTCTGTYINGSYRATSVGVCCAEYLGAKTMHTVGNRRRSRSHLLLGDKGGWLTLVSYDATTIDDDNLVVEGGEGRSLLEMPSTGGADAGESWAQRAQAMRQQRFPQDASKKNDDADEEGGGGGDGGVGSAPRSALTDHDGDHLRRRGGGGGGDGGSGAMVGAHVV